jgi:hypothetical protein
MDLSKDVADTLCAWHAILFYGPDPRARPDNASDMRTTIRAFDRYPVSIAPEPSAQLMIA